MTGASEEQGEPGRAAAVNRSEVIDVLDGVPSLVSGIVFGLTAGLTPGPTSALVLTQTMRHGLGEGLKVAAAPLLTDGPIILATLLVIDRFADAQGVLGAIALAGSAFLVYLAVESFSVTGLATEAESGAPQSWQKGAMTNLLNPHPYLFWLTVGGPTVYRAYSGAVSWAVLFLAGFYVCLVGSKALMAALVAYGRSWLRSRAYVRIIRLLGLGLLGFAALFLWDGLGRLGLIPVPVWMPL